MRKRGESAVLIGVAPSRERSINCGGYNAICVPRVSRRFRAEKRKAGTSVRRIKKKIESEEANKLGKVNGRKGGTGGWTEEEKGLSFGPVEFIGDPLLLLSSGREISLFIRIKRRKRSRLRD